MSIDNWEAHLSALRSFEQDVNKGEGVALRARWESGRCLLALREGRKQLPQGLAAELIKELGVSRSELTARMKFAEKFPTDEKLADASAKFKFWYRITQEALTETPRESEPNPATPQTSRSTPLLARVLQLIENVEPADLGAEDLDLLVQVADAVERLSTSVACFQEAA